MDLLAGSVAIRASPAQARGPCCRGECAAFSSFSRNGNEHVCSASARLVTASDQTAWACLIGAATIERA
eukprot:15222039-Alexandrium_andersonii.AAC.1